MAKKCIGLDIGSNSVVIYLENKGVIANEPSRIALDINSKEPVAFGAEAKNIARRTPGSVLLVNPVFEGSISDYDDMALMLEDIFRGVGITKPEIVVALNSGINTAEKKALVDLLYGMGARDVGYISTPTACALSAKDEISDDRAFLSLNIGAGVTDLGLVKGFITKFEQTVRYGCVKLDAAVAAFIKREYNAAVDEDTLADIRVKVGSVHESFDMGSVDFIGRDLVTGLPVSLAITSAQTRKAMLPIAQYICKVADALYRGLPESYRKEVAERGFLISGGGALTGGMAELLNQVTGLPVTLIPNATTCIIDGIGVAIENRDVFGMLIQEL